MKRNKLYYPLIIVVLTGTIFLSFTFIPQPLNNILNTLLFKIERYYNWYPQQKAYLHTDKTIYNASETVWFKAYLVNASNHRPDSTSTNLYVELIDPGGNIVQQKMLKLDKGFSNGDFSFKDTIPEGIYRLRAFTQLMTNTSKNFSFSKDLYISNPDFANYATRYNVTTVKKVSKSNLRKSEKFDVGFFAEGGHLLSGVENKIGFKAVNHLGKGVDVTGRVIDKNKNVLIEFKSLHAGIGSFRFTPQAGVKYSALVTTPDGKENRYSMPEILQEGITLSSDFQTDGKLRVSMLSVFTENYPANTTYFLLVHSRGIPVYTGEFDLKNENNSILIDKSILPSGVIHLTLFNAFSKPVSERLVFINHEDGLRVNIVPERSTASPREKLNLRIQVRDKLGNPVKGNFSLSLAEASDFSDSENILVNLLLNSDIKGKIENPSYYLTDYNSAKEAELDNLLLTQGWRRFSWTNVLENEQRTMVTTQENYMTISGKVTKEFFNIPLRDIPVTLSILSEYNDVYTTRTLYDGRFRFSGLQYNDTLLVRIEARRKSGKKNLVINLDVKSADRVKEMNYITYQQLRKPGPEGRYKTPVKPEEDEKENDPFYEKNTYINRIHSEPRDVIIVDDRFLGYADVAHILQGRVPGVMVNGYRVIIRGVSSFHGGTDPLFLVDNIPVEPYNALSMVPAEVQRIEVIKGPEAAIYGSRGGNGVIAIYTKRGKFMIKGMIEFTMQGYSTPKEYYSPKYPYQADDPYTDDRRTLIWVPYLITDSAGNAQVSFHTSDVKGNYIISVEGIDYKGTPGAGIARMVVQ